MKRKNIKRCRELRRNQTDAENKLWMILRGRQLSGVKFRRQFSMGGYILDFYCPEYKLGIEADGGQHYEEEGKKRDKKRGQGLSRFGIRLIRFSDYDILNNAEGVCKIIWSIVDKIKENSPSPQSSPQRGDE